MAATFPPDVSVVLTVDPDLNVENLVVDTSEVIVTLAETPILLSMEATKGDKGLDGATGPPGPQGVNACTLSAGEFMVPAVGGSAVVTVEDTSWIVVGQFLYVEGAGGAPDTPGAFKVTAKTPTELTLENVSTSGPVPGTMVPSGSLISPAGDQGPTGPPGPVGGGVVSTDPGNLATLGSDSYILVPESTIWNQRLRSYNALGNPTWEVDQRGNSAYSTNVANNTFLADRWVLVTNLASGQLAYQHYDGGTFPNVARVPGTNFAISRGLAQFIPSTAQASIGAGEYLGFQQYIEGPLMRELAADVHSVSLLVQSNYAPMKFSVSLRDPGSTRSLVKLCTIPTAYTWVMITLPNLPTWDTGGDWTLAPGSMGYIFTVMLVCGSTFLGPDGVWQNGNFLGATGMDNFISSTGNAFYIAMVQHEPGSQCTQLMDLDFATNLHDCARYFYSSYLYGVKPGSASGAWGRTTYLLSTLYPGYILGQFPYERRMAKSTVAATVYSDNTGAINSVRNQSTSADVAITGTITASDLFMQQLQLATTQAAGDMLTFQYTADTGW
jgi:hypothetical protein